MHSRLFVSRLFMAFALVCTTGFIGCNSDPISTSGPVDGTFKITSISCNGTPVPISAGETYLFTFAGSAFTFTHGFTDGCISTSANAVAYTSTGTFTVPNGNMSCSSSCSGSECVASTASANGGVSTVTYSNTGTTYTFTTTSNGTNGNAGCAVPAVYTATKQ